MHDLRCHCRFPQRVKFREALDSFSPSSGSCTVAVWFCEMTGTISKITRYPPNPENSKIYDIFRYTPTPNATKFINNFNIFWNLLENTPGRERGFSLQRSRPRDDMGVTQWIHVLLSSLMTRFSVLSEIKRNTMLIILEELMSKIGRRLQKTSNENQW